MSTTMTAPTAEDVRSELFAGMMLRHVEGDPGLNEARDRTPSYVFRHSPESRAILGVWRWRGLYDHRELLLPILENAKSILDHGGGACPLGFGADVVDSDEELAQFAGPYDAVFSSHTLEHCDAEKTVDRLWDLVAPSGWIILHVPAWTAPHWNAGTKRENDAIHGPHLWNFCTPPDIAHAPAPCMILRGQYVGDNSILVVHQK